MGMPYFEYDILLWNPTLVIVNWGMNDGRRKDGVDYYKTGIVPYVDKILANKIKVVLCSNSPIDIGDPPGTYTDFNKNFYEMAEFAKELASRKNIPFVDQFHFCHDLWGRNRQREKPIPVSNQTLVKYPSDSVHARGPGQLTMAYIILKTLHAPAEVSYASIDAGTGKIETRRCVIQDFQALPEGKGISFTRLDEASPCWINNAGAPGLELVPFHADLNRMTLQVTGLKEGRYALDVEGFRHGVFTNRQLADGINLSENQLSPVCAPGREVAKRITDKEGPVWNLRNNVTFFYPPPWLTIVDLDAQKRAEVARRLPEIQKADERIAEAALPKPLRYTLKINPE